MSDKVAVHEFVIAIILNWCHCVLANGTEDGSLSRR
jgi:hypothetical protein